MLKNNNHSKFFIEKIGNYFYIKNDENKVVKICNSYNDAAIQIESLYDNIIDERQQNVKVEASFNNLNKANSIYEKQSQNQDLNKVVSFMDSKIDGLESALKKEIIQTINSLQATSKSFLENETKNNQNKIVQQEAETRLATLNEPEVLKKIEELQAMLDTLKVKTITNIEKKIDTIETQQNAFKEFQQNPQIDNSEINRLKIDLANFANEMKNIQQTSSKVVLQKDLEAVKAEIVDKIKNKFKNINILQISEMASQSEEIGKEVKSLRNDINYFLNQINEIEKNSENLVLKHDLESTKNEILTMIYEKLKQIELNQFNDGILQNTVLEQDIENLKQELFVFASQVESISNDTQNLVMHEDLELTKNEIVSKIQENIKAVQELQIKTAELEKASTVSEIESLRKETEESKNSIKNLMDYCKSFVSEEQVSNIKKEITDSFKTALVELQNNNNSPDHKESLVQEVHALNAELEYVLQSNLKMIHEILLENERKVLADSKKVKDTVELVNAQSKNYEDLAQQVLKLTSNDKAEVLHKQTMNFVNEAVESQNHLISSEFNKFQLNLNDLAESINEVKNEFNNLQPSQAIDSEKIKLEILAEVKKQFDNYKKAQSKTAASKTKSLNKEIDVLKNNFDKKIAESKASVLKESIAETNNHLKTENQKLLKEVAARNDKKYVNVKELDSLVKKYFNITEKPKQEVVSKKDKRLDPIGPAVISKENSDLVAEVKTPLIEQLDEVIADSNQYLEGNSPDLQAYEKAFYELQEDGTLNEYLKALHKN
ncbi:hypothetical protein CXP39_02785 [Mesoplasma syrphidae]|uniref:Uncharacterized protein n=1 Tax=Mesoplasma syrphidae TaxID=225999 RepID=A0A2K9BVG6_9MOLU|nr:hypothetical protein [Mesoplasma syrphidae]AUF83710.1 hypothetical protein CXP39_02785 [Mesoplasma syrphidae]